MRPFILFAALIILAGCQTGGSSIPSFNAPKKVIDVPPISRAMTDLIGSGNYVLDGDLNDFVRLEYYKSDKAGYLIVSGDGKYAEALYCDEGAGKCEIGPPVFESIRMCEQRMNQGCYIYMRGQDVLWKGRTRIVTSKRVVIRPDELNKTQICHYALDHAKADATWATDRVGKYYAHEAKGRSIGLAECQARVTGKPDIPRKFKFLTDGEICNLAVTGVANVEGWSPIRKNLSFVNEGIARGFTPVTCMDAVFGKS